MSDRESYLIRLSEVLVPLLWQSPPPSLSTPESVFIAIWQLEADVNNGGFHQYYFNSAGDLAADAPAALEAIGAPNAARIVREANARFLGGPPRDRDQRQLELRTIPEEAFAELDTQFFSYPDDLSALLYAYVQRNRVEIRGG